MARRTRISSTAWLIKSIGVRSWAGTDSGRFMKRARVSRKDAARRPLHVLSCPRRAEKSKIMSVAIDLTSSQSADVRPLHKVESRVSLVTGGTDGIGRATALELARAGDRVLFVGRDERRGAQVLDQLR